MATLAPSPVLQVAAIVENAELGGCSGKKWRANRVNLRASASIGSLSSSGQSLQTLTGMRWAGAVDVLKLRSGRDFHFTVYTASTSGVDVVAEVEEKPTNELRISPAALEQEEDDSDEPARSGSFECATDSYRHGADRSAQTATKSSLRPGSIPSSVVSKRGGGKSVYVERWTPPGSKLYQVKQLLERLEEAEPTGEGVKAAMAGWDSTISPRDITSTMSNLKWTTAQAFFYWLQSEGYELNVVVYNVLLGKFRAGKAWGLAEEFAERMIDDGIQLDNYTYSTVISCALQCNLPEEALKWFDRMHETGCVPDEVTYSNMALVYSRLGRFNDAVELYERLRATGWKPDKITFGTMVNVYARGGNYVKASGVIREMQKAGLRPEALVFNTLIRYFAREGKGRQAKRVFLDMEKAGVKPSEFTLSLMIDVHGRAGETLEAFQLFNRMKEEKLPLDVVVYNSLLKMCAEERLVGEAENLLAGMVGRGLKPDLITYKSMINLYAREGRVKEAEKFANQMVEGGLSLDVVVYSCLIKGCGIAKDFKKAATFLDKLLDDGCLVDDKCCGVLLSLMNACETTVDRSIMIECLRKVKPVLGEVVEMLLGEELQVDALDGLVRKLLSESELDSHRPFCNALVDLCWVLGKKYRAEKLLLLIDSLDVYPGGLKTKTEQVWVLNLRSLSFNAAECGLYAWIHYLRGQMEGEEFPETLVIETGAGRMKGDVARLFNVILSKLEDIGSPFEPSPERAEWITCSGSAMKEWLIASPGL